MANPLLSGLLILIGLTTYVLFPLLFVVFAFARETFCRYSESRILQCPEMESKAKVSVDAWRAALASVVEKPRLRVKTCSLWPQRKGCAQACLRLSNLPLHF